MANHIGTCPNCKTTVYVDPAVIAQRVSRLKCWWCGYVEDIAAYELSQPGISPEARTFWSLVGVGAVIFGVIKFAQYVDGLA